ncbi:hypothetical protein [Alkalicoccobacillus porphyridii]|uniref:Uncharacterized protein n=1 Tax=Alkalicoccobacillus porphyridii TaxID=2597270 RepID=A0A553ZTI8_9BACI|nr:hypothetical protein [Alkalicoccobacillus porphyridii]TSB44791.1 hypothetical protein FN960_19500 [Alkalicoccobacillus porphyridii]
MTKYFLIRSCMQKDLIEIIYLSKSEKITQRLITAESISNGILTGYCHYRHQKRRFLVNRILSAFPTRQKQA